MKRRDVGVLVLPLLILVAVVTVHYSQASSQTAQSPTHAQQNEIAELKKQITALEQRVNTLERGLADVYRPKVFPLPLSSQLGEAPQEERGKPQKKRP